MTKKTLFLFALTILPSLAFSSDVDQSVAEAQELYEKGIAYKNLENSDKSYYYFDLASQKKHPAALVELAIIYANDKKVDKALELLDKAIKLGDKQAYYEKAKILYDRKDKKSKLEAVNLMKIAATKGKAQAYKDLASWEPSEKKRYQYYLEATKIDDLYGPEVVRQSKKAKINIEAVIADLKQVYVSKGETDAEAYSEVAFDFYLASRMTLSSKISHLDFLNTSKILFEKSIDLGSKAWQTYANLATVLGNDFQQSSDWGRIYSCLRKAGEINPRYNGEDIAALHLLGLGTKQDIQQALSYEDRSEYLSLFAQMYERGSGVPQNFDRAIRLRLKALALDGLNHVKSSFYKKWHQDKLEATAKLEKKDSAQFDYSLAILYLQEGKYQDAYKSFRKAVEEGEQKGDLYLIYMHALGLGCDQNFSKSFELIKKNGTNDVLGSSLKEIIGLNYLYGANGYSRNINEAKKYMKLSKYQTLDTNDEIPTRVKLSALLSTPQELLKRGKLVNEKKITEDQRQQAFYYLLASAKSGSGEANSLVGNIMFSVGKYREARKYFEQSAKVGFKKAEDYLGSIYLNGYGVLPDFDKAFSYFAKNSSKAEAYVKMSNYFSLSFSHADTVKICFLKKAISENPALALAWRNLIILDPRTGDHAYRLKLVGEACKASVSDKNIFCQDYKAMRNGGHSHIDYLIY